jgi:hypothetical protein
MKESTKLPSVTFSSESEVHLILVFAGLEARKSYGLQLLHERPASIILLSVGRFEIRKLPNLNLPVVIDLLKLAASIPPPLRHFFVWFENGSAFAERIQIGRFGTMPEIRALAAWLQERPEIRSMLIVSSAYHLYRIRLCCRALLPDRVLTRFVAAPETNEPTQPIFHIRWGQRTQMLLKEGVKIVVYAFVLWFYRRGILK